MNGMTQYGPLNAQKINERVDEQKIERPVDHPRDTGVDPDVGMIG
jgi:hypothetical protein